MRRFRDLPIRRKLMWVILSTSALSLLLACAAFVVYELGTFRTHLVQKLETQADIVGYNATSAEALLAANLVDMVAFGRPFIANPDLVRRLRENAPLNEADPNTFYGGAEAGYTDYPALT